MDDKNHIQNYTTMMCRTCLQSNVEMLNLSALINDNVHQDCKISYMDCLKSCIQLEEIEEDMPGTICLECASALQVAYWFMKNASQAQELLKTKLREISYKKQMETEAMEASGKEINKTKRYRCKICNVKVETKRSLKDHVKLHLDIIVYNCQLCTFESQTRSLLCEHYNQMHGVEPSKEQLKPKAKTSISSSLALAKQEDCLMGAITNDHFQLLPEVSHEAILDKAETITTTTNSLYCKPWEETTVLTPNQQQDFTTISNEFTALDSELTAVSNDLCLSNEFIVMADGSVEQVMGKGMVIEYINNTVDHGLPLDNDGLVLGNIMQVQNTDNTNMLVTQNDILQMDVDDLIIEDPVVTPEETQELPTIVDEESIPANVIKTTKSIVCKICIKDFSTQEQLKIHMLTHNEIPHFFCDKCSFYTFFKIDLHQHYKSKHNLHPTSKQLQPKNKPNKLKQVFTCDLCFFEGEFKMDLKRHYLHKHKFNASDIHLRPTTYPSITSPPLISKTTATVAPATSATIKNFKIKPIEKATPDYPNGLNCRKCHEVFYWRNKLYEHYKLHNAEEAALKQEKQLVKVQNKQQQISQTQKITRQQITTQVKTQPTIIQSSFEQMNRTTYSNLDSLSLNLTQNNTTLGTIPPITPSSNSTYTLPSDAIPQIVETDQTVENDMDFYFNGDALFEDFDDDVDVENDSDDNDQEFRNVLLTSDDDFENLMQEQNNPHNADALTESYCAHCQKNFQSQYQFENHMFIHRGLAPYRCEMCTNLYNTKRCLIRHYKAVHKKVPTRDMIQAKGDKVCEDKTPVQNLNIEESKSLTLMCAKCPYECTDLSEIQSHINTNHNLNDECYILRKLSFECPRCIRSFATKTKLVRHLERNHSSTPINKNQMQFDTTKTETTNSTSTSATMSNHVNMLNSETSESNATCGFFDEYLKQQHYINTASTSCRTSHELSIEDAVAPNIIMANFKGEDNDDNTNTSSPMDDEEQEEEDEEEEEEQALFKCKICHLICYNLDSFIKHCKRTECRKLVKAFRDDKGLFECEICHCSYKSMYLLKHHLKRHIGRKFRCHLCPKTFINQMELVGHQLIHSGERPHECDVCNKSFRYVHHMKRHKDIVHLGKRHECTEPNCNRKFTTLSQLKVHVWAHNGIVPYKCQFCVRLFKKRALLREHCRKMHKINLSEEEMAKIFRNSLGYTNPHDFTVAITNGKMLRRADLETMGASGVIKSSFK